MTAYAMNFVTRDGVYYSGDTAFQVVDAMRMDSAMTEHKTIDGYLHAAAFRYSTTENVLVRADTPDHFIHDLEAAGIIRRV